jgi:hypothetical protein
MCLYISFPSSIWTSDGHETSLDLSNFVNAVGLVVLIHVLQESTVFIMGHYKAS